MKAFRLLLQAKVGGEQEIVLQSFKSNGTSDEPEVRFAQKTDTKSKGQENEVSASLVQAKILIILSTLGIAR